MTYYHHQLIMTKGEIIKTLYKLTQGTVTFLDHNDTPFDSYSAPHLLNLTQSVLSFPTLKTIRANGKCHVIKIKIKQMHRASIRKHKEQGLKKSRFPMFSQVSPGSFYELGRFGEYCSCRKQHSIRLKQESLCFVVRGMLVLKGQEIPLKLVQMEEGQVILPLKNSIVQAVSDSLTLFCVAVFKARAILGEQYNLIVNALQPQKQSISTFQARNQRLSHQIRIRRSRNTNISIMPIEFTNPIELKNQLFDKYCRAKSSMSTANKSRKQIRNENASRFRELLQLNRKKYGQEYLCQKRMEVSINIQSTASPIASPLESDTSLSQLAHSVYSSFAIKQQYAVLQSHQVMQRWKSVHRTGKHLKKVGCENRKQKENWNTGLSKTQLSKTQLSKTQLSNNRQSFS